MSNPSKAKGTAWETAVVDYLRDHGFPYAERRALRGSKDCGDVAGIPGVVISCKNARRIELGEWCNELEVMMANAEVDAGILIIKRRGKPVGDAYVVQILRNFCLAEEAAA